MSLCLRPNIIILIIIVKIKNINNIIFINKDPCPKMPEVFRPDPMELLADT
jgi:hypothetical protein